MSLILSKSLTYGSQSFEIMVNYNVETNTVEDIKSIWLITHGKQWPVGNLMMKFFEPAINKIIDETDWQEVYREMREGDQEVSDVHPTIMQSLSPFVKS